MGRRTQRTTPRGLLSRWTYDPAGRPTHLDHGAGALSFTYDAAGRETERRLGDGVTLTQSWDTSGRLTTQSLTRPEAADASSSTAPTPTARTATSPRSANSPPAPAASTSTRSAGSPPSRPTAGRETYAYDTAGNLTHATAPDHPKPPATAPSPARSSTARAAPRYEHDAQGRLTRRTRKLLNGQTRTWTYTWNAEDRLAKATTPDGAEWHYAYDPLGRRISKHRWPRTAPRRLPTFTWDGTRLAEQSTPDGVAHHLGLHPRHPPPPRPDRPRPGPRPAHEPLPRHHHRPGRHPHRTRHPRRPPGLATPHHPLGHPPPHPTPAPGLPPPLPRPIRRPRNGPVLQLLPPLRPRNRPLPPPDPLGLEPAPNHHAYVENPGNWLDPLGLASCVPSSGPPTEKVQKVLDHVRSKGSPPAGYKGGRPFENTGAKDSQILPRTNSAGEAITYREWDVNPKVKGVDRGEERLVTGSDGSAYFTKDHYETFMRIS